MTLFMKHRKEGHKMDTFALIPLSRLLQKCGCGVPASHHGDTLDSLHVSALGMASSRCLVATVDAVSVGLFSFPCLGWGISPRFRLLLTSLLTHQKWFSRGCCSRQRVQAQSSAPLRMLTSSQGGEVAFPTGT